MAQHPGAAMVRPWWESMPCRDASPAGGDCLRVTKESISCSTDYDPTTGEPVKRCVKLVQTFWKCAGM